MHRDQLGSYLNELLEPTRFQDYCPNGLQVEGRAEIGRLVCGVTASQALLDAAIEQGADALLVHHGYFWRGEDGRITGVRRKRLGLLLNNDISLFAYHLPLDAHGELGNNAQLALKAGWQIDGRVGDQGVGFLGTPARAATAARLADELGLLTGRPPQLVGGSNRPIRRLAWCSGGGQDYFEQAIEAGADAFVSGEINEQAVHLARESGVAYIAAGHHATERYGVQAVAARIQAEFGLDTRYIEIDSPV